MSVPEVEPRSRAQSAWANAIANAINANIDAIATIVADLLTLDSEKVDKAGDTMTGPLVINDASQASGTVDLILTPSSAHGVTGGRINFEGAGANADIQLGNVSGKLWVSTLPTEISSGQIVAALQSGSYTPSLSGMVIGSGGSASNTAFYTFVGGPNVGDTGILTVVGSIVFGTSGQTFPTSPSISLPSGFNFAGADTLRVIGLADLIDNDTSATRVVWVLPSNTTTAIRVMTGGVTTNLANLSTTNPWTWASSDSIRWQFTHRAVRV